MLADKTDVLSTPGPGPRLLETNESSLSSPIRRLPSELLSEIFLHCCPPHIYSYGYGRKTPQIILSQVCNSWRNVAICTPTLWASIAVTGPLNCPPNTVELTKTWLSRSQGCPLSILYLDTWGELESTHELLQLVMRSSERWKNLDIVNVSVKALATLSEVMGRIPMLTELNLSADEDHAWHEPITTFAIAPNLRRVSVNSSDILVLPWSQLREFEARVDSVEDGLDVLRRSPNLEVYTLLAERTLRYYSLSEVTRPIRSDKVRSFRASLVQSRFAGQYQRGMAILLNHLTMPALVECHINIVGNHESLNSSPLSSCWAQEHLLSFWSRSNCRLTTLKFGGGPNADQLIECLQMTPHLISLEVMDNPSCSTAELFARLTRQRGSPDASCLVPNLQHISLDISFRDLIVMTNMLESRWRSPSEVSEAIDSAQVGLKSAIMYRVEDNSDYGPFAGDEIEKERLECLRRMRDEGLTMILHDTGTGRIV